MSNIYFKVTIEKKWHIQNFNFLNFKSSSPGQFLESFWGNFCLQLKNQRSGSKTVCGFYITLILKGTMTI